MGEVQRFIIMVIIKWIWDILPCIVEMRAWVGIGAFCCFVFPSPKAPPPYFIILQRTFDLEMPILPLLSILACKVNFLFFFQPSKKSLVSWDAHKLLCGRVNFNDSFLNFHLTECFCLCRFLRKWELGGQEGNGRLSDSYRECRKGLQWAYRKAALHSPPATIMKILAIF